MRDLVRAFGRTLVIAPHPDDEVLGAGGTLARLSAGGAEVYVAIVTTGRPPLYSAESVERVNSEAQLAHKLMGVRETFRLGLPAAELRTVSNVELNKSVDDVVSRVAPTTLLVPFPGDIHVDHQIVFGAALVAARPTRSSYPLSILAYETLSETNWNAPYITPNFTPNTFMPIDIELKLQIMKAYASQVREPPHERSLEAIRALATLRGATINRPAAEGFVLIRQVYGASADTGAST